MELILKKNIVLPNYQRLFVWSEAQVKELIKSFREKLFVQPITIGAKGNENGENIIIDGQQRLTSILLAYLGLFPDKATYKETLERLQQGDEGGDNPDGEENAAQYDDILKWTFKTLTDKGNTKEQILHNIQNGNYKEVDDYKFSDTLNEGASFEVMESAKRDFFRNTYLGFSYVIPAINVESREIQKFYSTTFRNMNVLGTTLQPIESRKSLYYLNMDYEKLFSPSIFDTRLIETVAHQKSMFDFVRYLSLLFEYKKSGNAGSVATGYKPKMEIYYEKFIYAAANDEDSQLFGKVSDILPINEHETRLTNLNQTITSLAIPQSLPTIIDQDIWYFGLIYEVIIEGKTLDATKTNELKQRINSKITGIKRDDKHAKSPGAYKYFRQRITDSVNIYSRYVQP